MNFQYNVREVISDEEKLRAYEIRKAIFGDELKDSRFIVDNKYFIDPWDNPETTIVVAEENESKKLIGTFRTFHRRTGEYIYDDLYFSNNLIDFIRQPKELVIASSFILSRGCVLQEYRRNGVYSSMADKLISLLPKGSIAIVCIETWNEHSLSPFLKRGFQIYQTGETRPGYAYNWIVKAL